MNRLLRAALDTLYPPDVTCALCGCELDAATEPLCTACRQELTHGHAHACPDCGRPMDMPGLCNVCRRQGPIADRCVAALAYEGEVRGLVVAFKLHDKPGFARLFACRMADALRSAGLVGGLDAIVPVPMHWRRRFHRGYNQSDLLARELGVLLGLPVWRRALARPVYTPPSMRLKGRAGARADNARRSYGRGRAAVEGKAVLLVDDILTTGSTLRACTALLRGQGAARVVALVAAAVPDAADGSVSPAPSPPAHRP